MSVHPDKTARRAVDACGGVYTAAEETFGFAGGHRAALASAMDAVGKADWLTADLLEALEKSAEGWSNALELEIILPQHRTAATILRDEALAAISRATEAQP